jgi:hypothetical protein
VSSIHNDIQQKSITDIDNSTFQLNITSPPFSHGQLYVTLSRMQDYNNIRFYVTKEQLMESNISSTGFIPTVDNIVYQDVLALNDVNNENDKNILPIDHSLEELI